MTSQTNSQRSPPRAVRLLLPVWGYRYVKQFLDCSLPTMLAPGNVPALAGMLPCTFVLLTSTDDAELLIGAQRRTAHAVAADHREVDESGVLYGHAARHGVHAGGSDSGHRRVRHARNGDEVALADPRDPAAHCRDPAGARIPGAVWERHLRIRKAQILRSFRSRADNAREQLDGHLMRPGQRDLER